MRSYSRLALVRVHALALALPFAFMLAGCATSPDAADANPFAKAQVLAATDENPKVRRQLLKELEAHSKILEKIDADYLHAYVQAQVLNFTDAQLLVVNVTLKKFEKNINPNQPVANFYAQQMATVRLMEEEFAILAARGQ